MSQTILMAGASGEVGKRLLHHLINSDNISSIHLLVRRPLSIHSSKVIEHVVDFNNLQATLIDSKIDHFICTLGSTIKQAGSQSAFEKVDLSYVIKTAEYAKQLGAQTMSVISSVGASSQSNSFYLKTKGRMEDALALQNWPTLHVFRPSLLTGERQAFRLGEKLGEYAALLIGPLLIGPLAQYKPIPMDTVAKAMAASIDFNNTLPSPNIMTNQDIRRLAKG